MVIGRAVVPVVLALSLLVAVALASGDHSSATQQTGARTDNAAQKVWAKASEEEFGCADGCVETIEAASSVGVDYKKIVKLACDGDGRGMHLLLWLSAYGGFDAASSEGHAAVLGQVLRLKGDRFFSKHLRVEPPKVRKAVLHDLRYDFGWECDAPTQKEMRRFPKTFGGLLEKEAGKRQAASR